MRRQDATLVAWTVAVITLFVALLSAAPFVPAIGLTWVLAPLFAYTAWRGALLPSVIGLALCVAAFLGSPMRPEDLRELALDMCLMWAAGSVVIVLWRVLKKRRG